MSPYFTILSTKTLNPAIIAEAEKYGIELLNLNFIETEIYVTPELTKAVGKTKKDIVFTSANAIEGFLKNSDGQSESGLQKRIFCLQGKTLTAARLIPNSFIGGTAKNAISLAQLIITIPDVEEVSFICGNIRRDELPEILQYEYIDVEEIEIYKTKDTGQLIEQDYKAVIFFSPSAVEAFFKTNKLPHNTPCFCLGNTSASTARLHTDNIVIAEAPSQQSILESITEYYNLTKMINQ